MQFIELSRQMQVYGEGFEQAILQVLNSGQYTQGLQTQILEKRLSAYVGVTQSIACANGTIGLQAALYACGVREADEVIVPGFSFVATANVVRMLGAIPIFADVHPRYYTIDPDSINNLITAKTKAIVTVSLFGQMGLVEKLLEIAQQTGIAVVEDGAQSFGATYRGKKSGSVFLIGATSFFPTKVLGGLGEGGAVFTNSVELGNKVRAYISHGSLQSGGPYELEGTNGRMSELQAALLEIKLRFVDREIEKRQHIAKKYNEVLGIDHPQIVIGTTSVYAQYSLRTDKRSYIRDYLKDMGIPTKIYYKRPLYSWPNFSDSKREDSLVVAKLCEEIFSIPLNAYMTEQEVEKVCIHLGRVVHQVRI